MREFFHRRDSIAAGRRRYGLARRWAVLVLLFQATTLTGPARGVTAEPPEQIPPAAEAEPTGDPASTTDDAAGSEPLDSAEARAAAVRKADNLSWTGQYREAVAIYRRVLAVDQDNRAAGEGLAFAADRLGDYEEALTLLEGADGRTRAVVLKAKILRKLGGYTEALAVLKGVKRDSPAFPAALRELGDLQEWLGLRDEAIKTYAWFNEVLTAGGSLPRDAAWLTDAAMGFYRYSILTQTNVVDRTRFVLHDMLQQAYGRVDVHYWPARIAAAELLLSKFNNSEDDGSVSDYLAALEINESLSEAHVGLGRVRLTNWNFEAVEEQVAKVFAVNPRDLSAMALQAEKLIIERRYEEAMSRCDEMLEINPNSIEAWSLRAAAAACMYRDEPLGAARRRVEEINPRCAYFYQVLGDAYSGIRQYADSERAYLRAIEYDETNANVRAELGMMYMQWGREEKAREALEAAWTLDPFNARTDNTLTLLESLAAFQTYDTEHFQIKYDAAKDPGLGAAMGEYLEGIYDDLISDYEHPLTEKTLIEVFPTQQAFAVRITGKPWIHTVGACTGRVIALASPRHASDLMGPYNFAQTLKHEFTHTVTLSATQNRIPHWFTEGLAVLQEDGPRSYTWSVYLSEAVRRDDLFTLASIDWGFIRPRRRHDRQMAYAQSEWMCEYIIERFGYEKINEMLERYREGMRQDEVMAEVLGVETEAFDEAFHQWARDQVRSWGFPVDAPEDPDALRKELESEFTAELGGRLAKAEYDAGDYEAAMKTAERTLDAEPANVDALYVAVSLHLQQARRHPAREREPIYEQLLPLARRLFEKRPEDWAGAEALAEVLLARRAFDEAEAPLKRLQRECPRNPMSWRGLAGVYLHRGESMAARGQLLELARLDENDVDARRQLGRLFRADDRLAQARYWYRQALYINPFDVAAQSDLADLLLQDDKVDKALEHYRLLTRLAPGELEFLEKAALTAVKAGRADEAREWASKAVKVDPQTSVRTLVQQGS